MSVGKQADCVEDLSNFKHWLFLLVAAIAIFFALSQCDPDLAHFGIFCDGGTIPALCLFLSLSVSVKKCVTGPLVKCHRPGLMCLWSTCSPCSVICIVDMGLLAMP